MLATITEEIIEEHGLLGFVTCRPSVPAAVEQKIVCDVKKHFADQLINKKVPFDKLRTLRDELERAFMKSQIQPGETVGIIAAQCIGEKTTQSSLNNFHSAGLDTGSTSQIDNLQNIINASRLKKREIRRYIHVSLFLVSRPKTIFDLDLAVRNRLGAVTFENIIKHHAYRSVVFPEKYKISGFEKGVCKLEISLEDLSVHGITSDRLVDIVQEHTGLSAFCEPYSSLPEDAQTVNLFIKYARDTDRKAFFSMLQVLKASLVCGIRGVSDHAYCQASDGEWYVQCLSNGIRIFFDHQDVFDVNRIACNSVHDMNDSFGVLVAQQVILDKCKEIMPGVDESHFRILASKMTKNGTVDPLTRYTMRGNTSPLSKASFEESFETFLKACKFKEKETFNNVSASIICGKKPKVGTYYCDILVDPSFYM
ncbi:hypothetical protein AV955_gp070 [Diadromus pulchellus ascovirus 4a]|uniref:DNA-directed RNA polymerase n=1 Tax=Diadromus pulchellus ascovirus 4a TaxID=158683 RepID=F2NYZ9_9VIRU|nr:hypothetical protein AV955_gp070 [Diadromus pulchellus ascovirus 4a]CCA61427.1 unnamed protein product [Diadromus pulchellus ascovirus 4a]